MTAYQAVRLLGEIAGKTLLVIGALCRERGGDVEQVHSAEKALRNARPVRGVPSLVPDSWELVSRDPRGEERVLATNVASYDVSPDGTIVYSNGRGVFVLDQHGSCELALADELVTEVIAAGA